MHDYHFPVMSVWIFGLLLSSCPGVMAELELTEEQRLGLYIGCSFGAVILLALIIAFLVMCCKPSKKSKEHKKKQKGNYMQFNDTAPIYPQHKLDASVYRLNGLANGKLPPPGAPIERSRSDVNKGLHAQRPGGRRPEWRVQQERRDARAYGRQDSGSDLATPAGIWTSNPTITHGLYPRYQGSPMMTSLTGNGVANGHTRVYDSEPAISENQVTKKRPKSKLARGSKNLEPLAEEKFLPLSVDTSAWDKPKPAKPPAVSNKRESSKIMEDTTKLLPGSSSEDTISDKDQQVVAKAYSNPAYLKDNTNTTTSTPTPSQESPFVAKVYSDYQLPRDYLPSANTPSPRPSSHSPGGDTNRRTTTTQNGHVAKAMVRQNSSFDSTGEPKYIHPQDAYKITQSDVMLYKRKSRQVSRTQSHQESAVAMPVAHGQNNNDKVQRSSSALVRKPAAQKPASDQVVTRNDKGMFVYRADLGPPNSNQAKVQSKVKIRKDKSKKGQGSPRKSGGLGVDIGAAGVVARTSSDHFITPVHNGGATVAASEEPVNTGPVVMGSSTRIELRNDKDSKIEHFTAPYNPEAIYAAPQRKDTPRNSQASPPSPEYQTKQPQQKQQQQQQQQEQPYPQTPLSPEPPPLPPVTQLRSEVVPVEVHHSPTDVHNEKPPQPNEEGGKSTPGSGRRRRRLKSNTSDGDAVSSGKGVIGDVFSFLDDFDDVSEIDAGKF